VQLCAAPRRRLSVEDEREAACAGELLAPVEHDVKTLHEAMDEVHDGLRLRGMLKIVLDIGNYINAGTYRANAKGFYLETLAKVPDTRGQLASSERTDLLRYIAGLCTKEYRVLEAFAKPGVEWQQLRAACDVHISDFIATFGDIKTQAAAHRQYLQQLKRVSKDDPFILPLQTFLEKLKQQTDQLQESLDKLPEHFEQLASYFGEPVKKAKIELGASEPNGKHVITEFLIQMLAFGDAFREALAQNFKAAEERVKAAERIKKKKARDERDKARKSEKVRAPAARCRLPARLGCATRCACTGCSTRPRHPATAARRACCQAAVNAQPLFLRACVAGAEGSRNGGGRGERQGWGAEGARCIAGDICSGQAAAAGFEGRRESGARQSAGRRLGRLNRCSSPPPGWRWSGELLPMAICDE
jgi:hypothetical protein